MGDYTYTYIGFDNGEIVERDLKRLDALSKDDMYNIDRAIGKGGVREARNLSKQELSIKLSKIVEELNTGSARIVGVKKAA